MKMLDSSTVVRRLMMRTRYFTLGFGIVYLLVGLLGFLPFVNSAPPAGAPHLGVTAGYGYLLGLFPVNVLHNVVHLLIGVAGIVAYQGYAASRNYARGLAVLYVLLAVLGLFPVLQTTFGLIPIFGNDVWLHVASAIVAAYVGFVMREEGTIHQGAA